MDWLCTDHIRLFVCSIKTVGFSDPEAQGLPKPWRTLGVNAPLSAFPGYSIIDKEALLLLDPLSTPVITNKHTAIFYLGIQFLGNSDPLSIWLFYNNQPRVRDLLTHGYYVKKATVAGIMMASTYGLVFICDDHDRERQPGCGT